MLKMFNKYGMTIICGIFFIQSIIVDYSKNENNFTWIGVMLYKIYSKFGMFPINAIFLFLTIVLYHSEKDKSKDNTNKKTYNNIELKTFVYLVVISAIVYRTWTLHS